MARRSFKWNAFERLRVKPGSLSAKAKSTEAATMKHAHRFVISRWENTEQVRRHMALWLIGVGLLIATAAVQFSWFNNTYMHEAPADGGTYAEGMVGDIGTLNPLYASSQSEQALARLAFSSLFTYDNNGALRGDLAKDIRIYDEGGRYEVDIRNDAVWQDGVPITARDVAFTIDLVKKPEVGSSYGSVWKDIKVAVVNDTKLEFTLAAPHAPFPHTLTFPIVPEHSLTGVDPSTLRESIFSKNPVGSGAFTIDSVQSIDGGDKSKIVRLSRNARYYGGLPKIERVQLHAYSTQDALQKSMQTGELSAASGLTMNGAKDLNKNRFTVTATPISSGVYALFNTGRGVMEDQKVRQALQAGTNVDEIIAGYPVALNRLDTPMTQYQTRLSDDIKKPVFDQAKARKMLDAAGWKLGQDGVRVKGKETLELNLVTVKNPDYDQAANKLAEQWRALGVKVQVRSVDTQDPAQNLASMVLQPRSYDVLVYELALGADPDSFAYWHSSQASGKGLNLTDFKDAVSDDILISARSRTSQTLREAKYQSFAKRWLEHAPAIGLYQSDFVYASKNNVRSIEPGAHFVSQYDRFNNVQNWTVRTGSVYKTP